MNQPNLKDHVNENINKLIKNYSDEIRNRFLGNSLALEVMICLIMIVLLIVESIKMYQKSYNKIDEYLEEKNKKIYELTQN
jgi:hypothetical protein